MNGWSESLRQQLQPGVREIVIEPGAVATGLTDHITDAETKAAAEQMDEQTAIAPQEIAQIIAFAMSRPRSVSLNEILVRPTGQSAVTSADLNQSDTRGTNVIMTTNLKLNNGVELPALGLGVFQTLPEETRDAVRAALETGYRHIDTAAAYGNEREVGEAMHSSGVDRSEVFLETKIWISDYGYDETLHSFEKSAGKLGVDQIDLLILHQALPSAFERTLEAYRALETLLADGKVRAIGVSNFMVEHLTTLLEHATVVPAVNQIELHPYFQQPEVQKLGGEHGILTQAWSPIGGITFYREGEHTSTLEDPVIVEIAEAHGKSPAQVMLRWGIQHGHSVIPKSTKPARIAENINVFDFELSADDLAAIDGLDTGRRGGPEPDAITLEAFGREIPEA
jgi:diketogulonate reductase-like aldo/keto reductase